MITKVVVKNKGRTLDVDLNKVRTVQQAKANADAMLARVEAAWNRMPSKLYPSNTAELAQALKELSYYAGQAEGFVNRYREVL